MHACMHAASQPDRQTDRQTDRQIHTHAYIHTQTHTHTHTHTLRHRCTLRECCLAQTDTKHNATKAGKAGAQEVECMDTMKHPRVSSSA